MNYEQKYKEVLEKARKELRVCGSQDCDAVRQIFRFFPELQEDNDEKTRKELISFIENWKVFNPNSPFEDYPIYTSDKKKCDQFIAWLEKQHTDPYNGVCFDCYGHHWSMCARDNGIEIAMDGKPVRQFSYKDCEQTFGGMLAFEAITEKNIDNQNCVKSANKVEPKFHKGDWIIHQGTENIYQVVAHIDNQYQLKYGDNYTVQKCADVDRCARLWNIAKDAKDGDVLANDHYILILKELDYDWYSNGFPYSVYAYCGIKSNGNFELGKENWCFYGTLHMHPATKEQRELLFAKMREAGYEWDAGKKELKKIELNFDEAIALFGDSNREYIVKIFKEDFGL